MAEEKKAPPKSIVKIQAWDGDWQMSEDLVIKCDLGMSITNFIKYIEKLRSISAHRIKIRLPNGTMVPSDRMQWALRRHGIQNESTVRVEPSRPGAWQWYDEEYYEKRVCTDVMDVLLKRHGEPILIDDLLKLVIYPPCYKTSFRVFLRRFPDQLRFRSDITTNNIYVCINEGFQILTYERIPQQLGRIKQYIPPDDDYWVDFNDVDSMNPVEGDLVLPTLNYQVGIMGGSGFGCEETLPVTNPFVVLLVDGKYVGYSSPKLATRAPSFGQHKLEIPFPYNTNFKKAYCVRVEIWNLNISKHEANCRQFCEIQGEALLDFFEPALVGDYYKTYALTSTAAEEERRAAEEKRFEEAEALYLLREIQLMELEDGRKEALDVLFEADRLEAEKQKAEDEALYGTGGTDILDTLGDDDDDDDLYDGFGKKPIKKTPEQKAYDLSCLRSSTFNGHIHLRGSKSILQIQVRGCYEIWSHDTEDSCEVNPFVIVVWNGLDVGDTTKRKLTRFPSWGEEEVFDIPCPGNMEVNQCVLEIQVWNRNTGLDKTMMGSLTMTSRLLKEFILHDLDYATRKSFELKVPDQEVINDEGEVSKIKSKQKGGFVSLLAGPVGLPEKNLKPFQIEIIVGGAMARTEVYCVLFWNSVEFGRTGNAPSVTERISKNTEKVTWTWTKNKFIFTMTEKEKMVKSELKIDCYDPTTKGINSYFGSIIVEKEELTDFLSQEHAQLRSFTLRKDPKRNDKEQKINRGTLSLKGGELGQRVETERLIEMRACRSLLGGGDGSITENNTNLPMCYVDAYWIVSGKPVLCGRTKPKPQDLNPFWEATDDRWAIPKDCKASGLYYANVVLKFEVWEGLPGDGEDEDKGEEEQKKEGSSGGGGSSSRQQKVLLGVCSMTQNELMDFAEAKKYTELELPLTADTGKSKAKAKSKAKGKGNNQAVETRIGGSLVISTPGIRLKTCFVPEREQEKHLEEYLHTYVDRKGAANLFEWSSREKHRGK